MINVVLYTVIYLGGHDELELGGTVELLEGGIVDEVDEVDDELGVEL